MARLQNEVGTKDFFRGTNFLTKNAPKFSPKFLSLYFVGQKKSRKIPGKFPAKFPSQKSKKIHQRASAGAPGEGFSPCQCRGFPPSDLTCHSSEREREREVWEDRVHATSGSLWFDQRPVGHTHGLGTDGSSGLLEVRVWSSCSGLWPVR